MATSTQVHLNAGADKRIAEHARERTSEEQAELASKLLQQNHDRHHIFSNSENRLHNHVAHHLLAIYALDAPADNLQTAYDRNASYQQQISPTNSNILHDLEDAHKFVAHLGPPENYSTFLEFFSTEIDRLGWEKALQVYLFNGDERADTMLVRMYAGFLHPIIHLGYGVEFHQPAIIAEALAQAACHEAWIGKFLLPAEEAAIQNQKAGKESKSIIDLIEQMQRDEKLKDAPRWEDGNKIRDGILARASDEMIHHASQFYINNSAQLAEKVAEMTNAVCYYTAAAQKPPHMIMYDFYFMHCVNASIFFSAFIRQKWLSDATMVRLLEWKVRLDLAMYASRKCPTPRFDEVRLYQAKQSSSSGWNGIQERVCVFPDDGHASKLVRALAHGQMICEPYEHEDAFRVKHDDWLKMGHMAIDSVENTERFENVGRWVRSAGFEKAWEKIPTRAQL